MADTYRDADAVADRALMDALFSERGRADPHAVVRSSGARGCRYEFVHRVLRDPRFAAPSVPPSADLMFQTVARFMSRLPPERHRAVRAHFAGLFTPRRVQGYRERIAAAGAHYCLGAPLARMHAEIALPALFTRLPGLRLAGALRWGGSVPVRQTESLAVTWN
jgi:cytochrome P450